MAEYSFSTIFNFLLTWLIRMSLGFLFLAVLFIISWVWLKRYLLRRVNNAIRPEYRDLVNRVREWFQVERHTGDSARHVPSTTHENQNSFESTDTGCPICLNDPALLPIQTNCGHKFCGNCIIAYWHRGTWGTEAIKCPVCRQRITLLMRNTVQGSAMPENLDQVTEIEREIHSYNRKFSGEPRSLVEKLKDVPGLLGHLFNNASFFGVMRLLAQGRMLFYLLAFLAYFVFPLDLLPESILGVFGLLDDLAALGLVLTQLAAVYRAQYENFD